MPSEPGQDEMVRLLDSAYDSSRMPTHAGAEFLAEVHARAFSWWLIRLVLAAALALVVGGGVAGYLAAKRPDSPPRESPALHDPGPGGGAAWLGARDGIGLPEERVPPVVGGGRGLWATSGI